jgi:hypothetical protein
MRRPRPADRIDQQQSDRERDRHVSATKTAARNRRRHSRIRQPTAVTGPIITVPPVIVTAPTAERHHG